MKYSLCFFPWIGAVIGALSLGWRALCIKTGMPELPAVLILCALPLIVTGGFHADGYMDTMDALHSYRPAEEKLRILKDPHIGAFSVIMLLLYYMIYIAAADLVYRAPGQNTFSICCCGFFLSRALSGLGILFIRPAKEDGMLRTFADTADRLRVRNALILQAVAAAALMLYLSPLCAAAVLTAATGSFLYYRYRALREFGGITGDTAGWFLMICECCMAVAAALYSLAA